MNIVVLDPRSGAFCADLFVIEAGSWRMRHLPLGYVPEVHYDPVARELVLVETELDRDTGATRHYWLKCYAADTLRLLRQQETPQRPMYTGYPGRSTRVVSAPSGRFLYVLESEVLLRHPGDEGVFRIRVHRY